MNKVFVTENSEGKKCGGCNWSCEEFYGIGTDVEDARSHFEADEKYGKGICCYCMMDLIVGEGYVISYER